MLIVYILPLIIAANIAGCIRCKEKSLRVFLGIAASVLAFLAVIWGLWIFVTEYRITEIDVSESPDGEHERLFQQVGDRAGDRILVRNVQLKH